jgi:hypothetical protein
LIIKKGACIYSETHMGINYEEIINLKWFKYNIK